jgi:hypothetical protein
MSDTEQLEPSEQETFSNQTLNQHRILEEWKANVDLHKFHDNLKHQRITHCLTAQGALFAVYGILFQPSSLKIAWPAVLLTAIAAMLAFVHVSIHVSMDRRARAFIDVVKGRLLLLEQQWNTLFPKSPLATYTQQWQLLVLKAPKLLDRYVQVRGIEASDRQDNFRNCISASTAHAGEQLILRVIGGIWIVLFVAAIFRPLL